MFMIIRIITKCDLNNTVRVSHLTVFSTVIKEKLYNLYHLNLISKY